MVILNIESIFSRSGKIVEDKMEFLMLQEIIDKDLTGPVHEIYIKEKELKITYQNNTSVSYVISGKNIVRSHSLLLTTTSFNCKLERFNSIRFNNKEILVIKTLKNKEDRMIFIDNSPKKILSSGNYLISN